MLRDIEAFETEEEPPDGALDDAFDTEMPSTKRLANHSAPRPT